MLKKYIENIDKILNQLSNFFDKEKAPENYLLDFILNNNF